MIKHLPCKDFLGCCSCRSGQNTVELLAIADKRVAELNEEIRMLEKQVNSHLLTVTNANPHRLFRDCKIENRGAYDFHWVMLQVSLNVQSKQNKIL